MALKTRKPTGRAGFPKILLEGGDKAGKSHALAMLSASTKVGRTVVMVLGEDISKWDEFGKLPGVRFELVEHDGSWHEILGQVEAARDEAARALAAGEKPMVLGIDTATEIWNGLKDWATACARNSQKNRKILANDPDAEIDVTANYWNNARARWRQLMRVVLTFPGIVVLVARGSEVTLFQNGQPVANQTTWSVEGEKNLPFDMSAHIRLSRDAKPRLISAASLACPIRPGIDRPLLLPADWSLEQVIFDTLKLDPVEAAVGGYQEMKPERMTPEQIRDEAFSPATTFARVRELHALARHSRYENVALPNETGVDEPLLDQLKRAGDWKRAEEARQAQDHKPGEAEWVTEFIRRLADTADLPGIAERKNEVNRALAERTILPATASDLQRDIAIRQREITEAAEGKAA